MSANANDHTGKPVTSLFLTPKKRAQGSPTQSIHPLLIMLTSLAPSPMARVTHFLWRLTKSTTIAFCSGVTRQQITALQRHAKSRNVASSSGFRANAY